MIKAFDGAESESVCIQADGKKLELANRGAMYSWQSRNVCIQADGKKLELTNRGAVYS